MAVVLVLQDVPAARMRIRRALDLECAAGAKHELHWADGWDELNELIRMFPHAICIINPYYQQSDGIAVLAALTARYPSLRLVAYASFVGRPARELMELSRLGVTTAVTLDTDDDLSNIRQAVSEAAAERMFIPLLDHLRPMLPPGAYMLLNGMLHWPMQSLTADQMVRCYGWHRRTLERHLKVARLPPPSRLLMWCRFLKAAHLLQDVGRNVGDVAFAVGFTDGAGLRKALRRYSGLTPRELRHPAGMAQLVELFVYQLHSGKTRSRDG